MMLSICTQDIFQLDVAPLTNSLTDQLLAHFVLPVLFSAMVQQPRSPLSPPPPPTTPASSIVGATDAQFPVNTSVVADESAALSPPNVPDAAPAVPAVATHPTAALAASSPVASAPSFPFNPLHRSTAFFMLAQLLAVFRHDEILVNALACAILHPRPPRLVAQLVRAPPLYPIKAKRKYTSPETVWCLVIMHLIIIYSFILFFDRPLTSLLWPPSVLPESATDESMSAPDPNSTDKPSEIVPNST